MKSVFKEVLEELKKYDFIVGYYFSYSTTSIYIKLDYGVANGIRIADHNGKEKYKYRYNIMKDIKNDYVVVEDGLERFYFREDSIQELIFQILKDKQAKLNRYGISNYQKYMEANKKEDVNKRFKIAK